MTRAVVFAYHNVGVRCLRVLLSHGVDVPLVVTHRDDPAEDRWFASVADLAAECGIARRMPEDPNAADFVAEIEALAPDFLFSFYYRSMLGAALLDAPRRGALNMHGSLLPRYRGRAPVNWAVLNGERETGATLHYMTAKADAGDIVAQAAIPILADDTAREVFDKVTVAAEIALNGVLPALIAGTAPRRPQDLSAGRYFGRRRAEDGTIDWRLDAAAIHNLVRAVAPPYPGARTTVAGVPARILRSRLLDSSAPPAADPVIEVRDGRLVARCGGGGTLHVLALEVGGMPCDATSLLARHGGKPVALGSPEGHRRGHV
jgi:methionyl-tRNA formyltransferase